MAFLTNIQLRPLASGGIPGCKTLGFALGQGQAPLEVVVMECATQPAVTAMRTAWKDRHGGRPAPVLLVAIYGNRAAICGPSGDSPPVLANVEPRQAERLCRLGKLNREKVSSVRLIPGTEMDAFTSTYSGARGRHACFSELTDSAATWSVRQRS